MGSLISEVVTDGVKALNTKEPVAPVGRIDKHVDGLAGRAELSIAARTHAAFNNMISEILPPEKASKLDATV